MSKEFNAILPTQSLELNIVSISKASDLDGRDSVYERTSHLIVAPSVTAWACIGQEDYRVVAKFNFKRI